MPYAGDRPDDAVRGSSGVASKKETCGEVSFSTFFTVAGRRPYFFLIELISCAGVA